MQNVYWPGLFVCLSVCPSLHSRTTARTQIPDVTWRNDMGCPVVVHYWADLTGLLLWQHTRLIALYTAEREMSANTCTRCMAGFCFTDVVFESYSSLDRVYQKPTSDLCSKFQQARCRWCHQASSMDSRIHVWCILLIKFFALKTFFAPCFNCFLFASYCGIDWWFQTFTEDVSVCLILGH